MYRIRESKSPQKSHPDGYWLIAFRSFPFYSRGEFPDIHWTGSGVSFTTHLDLVKEQIQTLYQESLCGFQVKNPSTHGLNHQKVLSWLIYELFSCQEHRSVRSINIKLLSTYFVFPRLIDWIKESYINTY